MAMLSMTRWAIPPLSWKGYASSIRLASAMPIFVSRSAAAARASRLLTSVCSKSTSSTWRPMGMTGLSAEPAFWKTRDMSLPRILRSSFGFIATSSVPSSRTLPLTISPGNGTSWSMDRAVTVLPEPLSPTIPRTLCSSRLKLTPLTALTVPSVVLKWVWRSTTSRSAFAI